MRVAEPKTNDIKPIRHQTRLVRYITRKAGRGRVSIITTAMLSRNIRNEGEPNISLVPLVPGPDSRLVRRNPKEALESQENIDDTLNVTTGGRRRSGRGRGRGSRSGGSDDSLRGRSMDLCRCRGSTRCGMRRRWWLPGCSRCGVVRRRCVMSGSMLRGGLRLRRVIIPSAIPATVTVDKLPGNRELANASWIEVREKTFAHV